MSEETIGRLLVGIIVFILVVAIGILFTPLGDRLIESTRKWF